jgi:hypothetical protein
VARTPRHDARRDRHQIPTITLADVHAALAYYFDHIEEIQQEMKAERAFAEEFRGARTLRAASALLPTPGA